MEGKIDEAKAKELAGEAWDEAKFKQMSGEDGTISAEAWARLVEEHRGAAAKDAHAIVANMAVMPEASCVGLFYSHRVRGIFHSHRSAVDLPLSSCGGGPPAQDPFAPANHAGQGVRPVHGGPALARRQVLCDHGDDQRHGLLLCRRGYQERRRLPHSAQPPELPLDGFRGEAEGPTLRLAPRYCAKHAVSIAYAVAISL